MRGLVFGFLIISGLFSSSVFATVPPQIGIQGRLTDSVGIPLPEGVKHFKFAIYDSDFGGTQIWPDGLNPEEQSMTTDAQGFWSHVLGSVNPLGYNVFNSGYVWLEVRVDVGDGVEKVLPRVRIVSGAYAHQVGTVDGAFGGVLNGKLTVGVTNSNQGSGAFLVGDSNTALSSYASVVGGINNSAGLLSTVGGGTGNYVLNSSFIGGGTSNHAVGSNSAIAGGSSNQALGTRSSVAGGNTNIADGDYSHVGGGSSNSAGGDYAIVGGGASNQALGPHSLIGAGDENIASGDHAIIAGGSNNRAGGGYSFVGGGGGALADSNSSSGYASTVVGGRRNVASGMWASVGGGFVNLASGNFAAVGGGRYNVAGVSDAVIAGGSSNSVTGGGSFIGGGFTNSITGMSSFIGGGESNTAWGFRSAIPGGSYNSAGPESFAAGVGAKANHRPSFVWNGFATTNAGQFLIKASAGVGIGTNTRRAPLHVMEGSAGGVTADDQSALVLERNNAAYIHLMTPDGLPSGIIFGSPAHSQMGSIRFNSVGGGFAKGLGFITGNNNLRMKLDSLGNLTVTGCVSASNLVCPSDGRFKHNIQTLSAPLEQVARLRGVRYEWKTDDFAEREFAEGVQIGLVAQEVREVVPQAVIEQNDGYLAVDYARLVPLLIEGMKEQQKRIEKLEETIRQMQP